jgi:hypothetical protein
MRDEQLEEIKQYAARHANSNEAFLLLLWAEERAEVERLRAQVEAVEALIGYGYSVTRSADQGGGVAIVIEETAIEEALANAWDDGWTVGASALTDRYKSGRPNPHRAAFASAGEHDSGCDLHRPHTGNCSTALASEVHDAR